MGPQGPYILQLCMGPSYFWGGLTPPDPPLFRTLASAGVVTERARDWRRTNRVVLEYNADVAQRLTKLAEHRTPADHPDAVRLARDLLVPPPDNRDGIKHARYITKTPQAEKVDENTHNMVSVPLHPFVEKS